MQELEKEVHLVVGFYDTPLLLWALKRTPGNLDRVYFERQLPLNRHFLQVTTTAASRATIADCACAFVFLIGTRRWPLSVGECRKVVGVRDARGTLAYLVKQD